MPKLRLKRTPAEEAEHQLRKAQRAARKSAKRQRRGSLDDLNQHSDSDGRSEHRRHREVNHDDDDDRVFKNPNHKDRLRSDCDSEEERFKEKLFGAYEDDVRLFSLEERLNDFAHVPHRWRSPDSRKEKGRGKGAGDDEDHDMDPQHMSDEQYAEWVRAGMWRRKHAAEYEEQRRQQAEMDARRAREEAVRAETARLASRADGDRRRKKQEREDRRWSDAREAYDTRWRNLLIGDPDGGTTTTTNLKFEDIPWPILSAIKSSSSKKRSVLPLAMEDLTEAAISAFLLPDTGMPRPRLDKQGGEPEEEEKEAAAATATARKKERKEKLREAMLRFHPDKFEGRVLKRVRGGEREKVREGVGQVARVLNALMVKENG